MSCNKQDSVKQERNMFYYVNKFHCSLPYSVQYTPHMWQSDAKLGRAYAMVILTDKHGNQTQNKLKVLE